MTSVGYMCLDNLAEIIAPCVLLQLFTDLLSNEAVSRPCGGHHGRAKNASFRVRHASSDDHLSCNGQDQPDSVGGAGNEIVTVNPGSLRTAMFPLICSTSDRTSP